MPSKRVIIRPLITEKTMRLVSGGQYTFEVDENTSKNEIAAGLKRLFGVDAVSVKTHKRPGKTRRVLRQRRLAQTSATKLAIVRLKDGQRIDGFDKVLEVTEDGNN